MLLFLLGTFISVEKTGVLFTSFKSFKEQVEYIPLSNKLSVVTPYLDAVTTDINFVAGTECIGLLCSHVPVINFVLCESWLEITTRSLSDMVN